MVVSVTARIQRDRNREAARSKAEAAKYRDTTARSMAEAVEINPESEHKFHEALSSYAGSAGAIINPTRVKQVSWKPRAIVYHGFLADLECDHLISIAKSELKGSAVANNFSGESKLSKVRTSFVMFIYKNTDIFVAKRETEEFQRISKENRERALNPQHPFRKGRVGYARLEDNMVKETGEMIIPRVDVWVSARVNKAGEIDNENIKSVKDKCFLVENVVGILEFTHPLSNFSYSRFWPCDTVILE
ncbi:procollagen-proline 4-dioxygenase [Trifolium repens]|nr:procollagen-proline 4-dioxygenase [Trifolium repens]